MDALTMDETIRCISEKIENHAFIQHGAINVGKLVNMQSDKDLHDAVSACDLISIDGMGLVWGGRLLGHDIPERVTGIDLFWRLVELSAESGYPIYLLGATQEVIDKTTRTLQHRLPQLQIAGHHHGYFWDDEQAVVDNIRESGAKLLFVAITSPRKEVFINKWKSQFNVNFAMGVGGTFDVVAGKVKRAPEWMQRAGLEWLYRVMQEPRRMFRRYLITNLRFAGMMTVALSRQLKGRLSGHN